MTLFEDIISLARVPDEDRPKWLENAIQGVDFLKKAFKGDEIILYANGPHFYVHSVLTPNASITTADHKDLSNSYLQIEDAWCIQRSYGGGEGHRVYLEPPLSSPGCKSLAGGEKLIFIRDFIGMKDYVSPIEINQKLIHALNVHYLDERQSYCRLDNRGDLEDVIRFYKNETHDPWARIRAVTVKSSDLAQYLALSEQTLVAKFDFTRFSSGDFVGWQSDDVKKTRSARPLF